MIVFLLLKSRLACIRGKYGIEVLLAHDNEGFCLPNRRMESNNYA